MGDVKRIYVEKKPPYAVAADKLKKELARYLDMGGLTGVRILVRYDVENVKGETYQKALHTVFSEPPVDDLYEGSFPMGADDVSFSVTYLPGQFDQRADSAEQCVKLISEGEEPVIRSAMTYVLSGQFQEGDVERIKDYCINPVDSKETDEAVPPTLVAEFPEPEDVGTLVGLGTMDDEALQRLYGELSLAMTLADFLHIRTYFVEEEKRDPTVTEIRMLDTYWSDHCRHTTFLTELTDVEFEEGPYREAMEGTYQSYLQARRELYRDRPDKYVSLMDLATMAMKKLRAEGKLSDMEESDEINACSIIVPITVRDDATQEERTEEWLVFFKNETHNHPTEIEPFGGAATCLGGAIRDPLSGRGYVYQAMRVTGAADPTVSLRDTMKGKLAQRKIVNGAADGYSSYGNQIGLATGLVNEVYHPNYVAKRMEIGAVMGAAPRKNVVRGNSEPGDVIILLGGRTGRDGCGGATGSSKVHTTESIETCGAEVQKGNPPTERKIQRLFRREEVSLLIKKCNDFGAGGVSVAIGELADGLRIDLDKVPKKYAGLDGTELAISESQERMAVVVDEGDADAMLAYAAEENLEAVVVAVVTEEKRLVMQWRGRTIVDVSRAFLDTNGAHQTTKAVVCGPKESMEDYLTGRASQSGLGDRRKQWLGMLKDLNVCSQKGLVEMFDGSIGASTVHMPYGGAYQLTPIQTMVAKLPVRNGSSDTVTMMAYGFDPYLSSWSPYHGAAYAVLHSVAKVVAVGGDCGKIRFTFQEYFKRMGDDPKRWGEPMAALLGAYDVQMGLGLGSIGGKDSMSGTFETIDVPPTLCSFAVGVANVNELATPELKKEGNALIHFTIEKGEFGLPKYEAAASLYGHIAKLIGDKVVLSAYAVGYGGVSEAVSKMAFGNKLGVEFTDEMGDGDLFGPGYGNIVAEVNPKNLYKINVPYHYFGMVTGGAKFVVDGGADAQDAGTPGQSSVTIGMEEALRAWTGTLEDVFPTKVGTKGRGAMDGDENASHLQEANQVEGEARTPTGVHIRKEAIKPNVFIPVFPGTNCEYDTERAFLRAGASVSSAVFRNMDEEAVRESVRRYKEEIRQSQILMLSGGFSAGDEPDGSAKFIASVFRNEGIMEEVHRLLYERDGLVLGICNGFQALLKLGLLTEGKIVPQREDSPTLTTNAIGRHVSKYVYTKVASNHSPWLGKAAVGNVYAIPVSHGEGRFVANEEWMKKLFAGGQVVTQYVDAAGKPTMDEDYNPNGSYHAIEGITSPDGRVFGKMGHSERRGEGVAKNITGEQNQYIFESGVGYFADA